MNTTVANKRYMMSVSTIKYRYLIKLS